MKSPALCSEECGYSVFTCMCGCGCAHATWTGYLRSAVDAQRAHPVHSHVTHIHTLGVDLNTAALEVLLVIHTHLDSWGKENKNGRKKVTEVVSKLRATPKEGRNRMERL